jgi:sugar phosphate isomerase/epimerase
MQASFPLEEVVPNLAKHNYDGIELRGFDPHLHPDTSQERAEQIKYLCAQHHINVVVIASYAGGYSGQDDAYYQLQLTNLEKHCRLAVILGCNMVRHAPGGPPAYLATLEDYKHASKWIRQACCIAANYGLRIVMEIHPGGLIESAEEAMKLVNLVDQPNLGLIHDAGNMYICGVDYGEESVKILGDRLFHVHIKDELEEIDPAIPGTIRCQVRTGEKLIRHTLLNQGGTDHRPLLRALKRSGYSGYLSLECHTFANDPTIPGKEIASLRKLIKEVEV